MGISTFVIAVSGVTANFFNVNFQICRASFDPNALRIAFDQQLDVAFFGRWPSSPFSICPRYPGQ